MEVKKSRVSMLPWKTHARDIIRISIINTFAPPSPRDFVELSLGNCPQLCEQDIPKKVGVAAHAVITKVDWLGYLLGGHSQKAVMLSVTYGQPSRVGWEGWKWWVWEGGGGGRYDLSDNIYKERTSTEDSLAQGHWGSYFPFMRWWVFACTKWRHSSTRPITGSKRNNIPPCLGTLVYWSEWIF
jgi:hypothetical protein